MRWEYKVVYVEGWGRVSSEGVETYPEHHERRSGFGRRFLNELGAEGWELTGIQVTMPNSGYYVFKRPLEDGAEPDLSVVKSGIVREEPTQSSATAQATSL